MWRNNKTTLPTAERISSIACLRSLQRYSCKELDVQLAGQLAAQLAVRLAEANLLLRCELSPRAALEALLVKGGKTEKQNELKAGR
jgi:hypothetical protein